MKDILIVHVTVSLGTGLGTFLKNIIINQLNDGNKVVLCTYAISKNKVKELFRELPDGLILINLEPNCFLRKIKKGLIFRGIPHRELQKQINRLFEATLVVYHYHNPVSIGVLGAFLGIPKNSILTLHGSRQLQPHVRRPEKYIVKKLSLQQIKIVAVSEHTANIFKKAVNISNISVIPNGIDVKSIKGEKENSKFRIGFVSHLSQHKGWERLLEAFIVLNRMYPNKFELVIAGAGNQNNEAKLKTKIFDENLEAEVKYLGYVPDASVNVIPLLDVLVLPSLNEGFGLVVVEAMAQGIPAIVSSDGGMKEIIQDNYNGLLLYDNSVNEIVEKIKYIYFNEEKYIEFKSNAKDTYKSKYGVEVMIEKYNLIYDKTKSTI